MEVVEVMVVVEGEVVEVVVEEEVEEVVEEEVEVEVASGTSGICFNSNF